MANLQVLKQMNYIEDFSYTARSVSLVLVEYIYTSPSCMTAKIAPGNSTKRAKQEACGGNPNTEFALIKFNSIISYINTFLEMMTTQSRLAAIQSHNLTCPSHPQVTTLLVSKGCQSHPMQTLDSWALNVCTTLLGFCHSQKKHLPSLSPERTNLPSGEKFT